MLLSSTAKQGSLLVNLQLDGTKGLVARAVQLHVDTIIRFHIDPLPRSTTHAVAALLPFSCGEP